MLRSAWHRCSTLHAAGSRATVHSENSIWGRLVSKLGAEAAFSE